MKSKKRAFGVALLAGAAAVIFLAGCRNPLTGSLDQSDGTPASRAPGTTKFTMQNPNDWVDDGKDGKVATYGIKTSVDNNNYLFSVDWTNNPSYGFCYAPGWTGAPETVNYSISTLWNPQAGCSGLYGWLNGSDGYTEFYVCETVGWEEGPHNNDNDGLISPNTQAKPVYVGSYECDGCTYDFYTHVRKNKPNPKSASSFMQWIAVNRAVNPEMRDADTTPGRLYPRLSGTISLKQHQEAWKAKFGKTTTTTDWTVFTVEAWITPPQNKEDPKNKDIYMNPDGHGTTLPYTSGKETVKFTTNPASPTVANINLIGPSSWASGITMCMDEGNFVPSETISWDDQDAIFTMYTLSMTQVSYPWASFPNDNYTHGGEIVAFKNGGKFLTVDDAGNVVRSEKSDVAELTDAEKFVYDNNYGYCDFMSLKSKVSSPEIKGYYRLNGDGKCLAPNGYGNFSMNRRNDTPPQPAPPNYYYLNNNWSEKLLTVADTSGYANILSQTLNTGWASQKWRLEGITGGPPSPGASVRIRNIWSGKYLTVANTSDYADVKAQDLNTGWTSQVWVVDGDLAQARFKNAWSSKYLTVTSQAEGAAIKCQPFNYDWPSQLWRFQN